MAFSELFTPSENLGQKEQPVEIPFEVATMPKTADVTNAITKSYNDTEAERMLVASNIKPEYQPGLTRLKQGYEKQLFSFNQEKDQAYEDCKGDYTKLFEGCFGKDCPKYEDIDKRLTQIKASPNANDFVERLRREQKGLETPLLDPLDIIMLLSIFTSLLKVGLRVLAKGCSLVISKTGEILLKTEAGTQVLEMSETGAKAVKSIIEKYKGKISGFNEVFEPSAVTPEGISVKVPKGDKLKGISKAEGVGVDTSDVVFNKLKNAMILRNSSGELVRNEEFVFKIERMAQDLNIKDVLDEKKLIDLIEIIERIEDFLVHKGTEIARNPKLQLDTRVALRTISNTMREASLTAKADFVSEYTLGYAEKAKELYKLIGL